MEVQRTIGDGPFCWQNKNARRQIRLHFAEANCVSSALSVYDALCELASDFESESFQVPTPTIASVAGLGTRTAQTILQMLAAIGLVEVEGKNFAGTNMTAPSVYTLLPASIKVAPGNGCAPPGNGCASVRNGQKQTSLRTSEESEKKQKKKETEESVLSPTAPRQSEFSPTILETVYRAFPRREGKQPALKAIQKALTAVQKRGESDPVAWMLQRIETYANCCRREGKEKQHIKMPQGWFNDGRYDDDLSQPVAPVSGTNGHASPAPTKRLPSSKDLYPATT